MAEKILVAEDNPTNMKLITVALKKQGYTLLQAADGEEALEAAARNAPDLIIMDMQLPKISGWEVTRKLRQMPDFGNVPIIAVTACAMKEDKEKAIEAGCNAYLPKPIDINQLRSVVAEMLLKQGVR